MSLRDRDQVEEIVSLDNECYSIKTAIKATYALAAIAAPVPILERADNRIK